MPPTPRYGFIRRILPCLGLVGWLTASFAQGAVLHLHYDFSGHWKNGAWTGEWTHIAGEPSVPVVYARLLLPVGHQLTRVRTLAENPSEMRPMSFGVEPFPIPSCENCPPVARAARSFREGERYPTGDSGRPEVQRLYGYAILYLALFPVEYYPTEGQGRAYAGMQVDLQLRGAFGTSALYRGLDEDRMAVMGAVDNPGAVGTYDQTPPPPKSEVKVEYVVIGPASLLSLPGENSVESLLDEKRARGLTAGKMAIEEIEKEYAGRDTQEKIRNAIRYYYSQFSTRYILLVGDGAEQNKVRRFYADAYTPTLLAADVYYACLDGSFDGNGNGYFGEQSDGENGEDVDLSCEMAVGRAPARNEPELRAFVEKTLQMQKVTPEDAQDHNALLIGERMDASTLAGWVLKELINGVTLGLFKTHGYPEDTHITKLNDTFVRTVTARQVIDTLNEGNFYTVNHLGHANPTYAMKLQMEYLSYLKNPNPFFGYTQGCYAGDLTVHNWAATLVTLSEGGAAGMIANSAYGFYGLGGGEGQSSLFARVFFDTAFEGQAHEIGKIQYASKRRLVPRALQDAYARWVYYETNLLADPELALRF